MDNITHSLAGLIIGDAVVTWRARRAAASGVPGVPGASMSPRFRAAALTASVLANNAPDLDFVYVGITGGKLGYLLHHRGHTHTLSAVLPLAGLTLALLALGFWLRRRTGPPSSRTDRAYLVGLSVLGGLVHVLMDYGNNYGVHPFWPLYSGWVYGDAIFIIEPWLMLALIGMAGGASRSRVLRGVLLACLAALLALAWSVDLASPTLAAALTVCSVPWVLYLWRASPRRRWQLGGAALLALWLVLLGTRHVARASVRQAIATAAPELRTLDLVSTPAPGNPLCWSVLVVQRTERQYVVRQARASGWPWLSSAESCRVLHDGHTAPLVPSRLEAAGRRVVWDPEFRAPLAELTQLEQDSCVARAFLRFARVPYWVREGSRTTLVGDLRFDRSSAVEFAELPLEPEAPCPELVPPWQPPLAP